MFMGGDMASCWIEEELCGIDLGDKRLNNRLLSVAGSFARCPGQKIYQIGDKSATKGAYRLFANERIMPSKIQEPHRTRTVERAKSYKTVLNIQDTCNVSFPGHIKTTGLGYQVSSQGVSPGALTVHNSYVLSPQGLPLGLIDQQIWARHEVCRGRSKNEQKTSLFMTPFEEKESMKWVNSMRAARDLIDPSIEIINIGDREADIYEFMYASAINNSHFIVRAKNERIVELSATEFTTISELFLDSKVDFKTKVNIVGNSDRSSREAKLNVRYKNVTLSVPNKYLHDLSEFGELRPIKACIIWVTEAAHSPDLKPINWLLITNKKTSTKAQAAKIIFYYSKRWMVELFHKSLKSGCKIEDCQLEGGMRISRFIALVSIIAHRVLELTYLYRLKPKLHCNIVLGEHEWKALWFKVHRNHNYPDIPPTISEVVRWIARLGGFLWRKSDGQPGLIVMWNGWQKLSAYIDAWEDMQGIAHS
jgi:hypothetical protein